jgi:DNA primase
MISEEEISQVRNATDLVALIGSRVVLKQRRQDFWGCCPFHNEKTPSFKVDPTSQFYHCFGCGESGDVFTYTMKTENVDFPDAVRLLAQRANIQLAEEASSPQKGRKARLLAVAAASADFFHQQLMRVKSPKADAARAYLAARGLGGEVARQWQLGFAPGQSQLVKHLREAGFTAQEMVDVDVARFSNSGNQQVTDRFYDRIVFPITDLEGRPIAFGGRVFLADDPSSAKYLNSAETMLFKKRDSLYAINQAKASIVTEAGAIVVEGYTDTIALHSAGFTNTVATLGTALTEQHLKLLARFSERVVLLFDGDEAGQRAADRAMDLIESALAATASERRRAGVWVALLPAAQDPADYLASAGAPALKEVLDKAIPLVRYSLDRLLARYALDQIEQRSRAEAAALQLLLPLRGTALASDYLSYLADCFNMNEMTETEMRQRFERLAAPRRVTAPTTSTKASTSSMSASDTGIASSQAPSSSASSANNVSPSNASQPADSSVGAALQRINDLERELLYFYIENPELRDQLNPALAVTNWANPDHQLLAEELLGMNQSEEKPSMATSLAQLTARLPQAAASLSAARLQEYSNIPPVRMADLLLFHLRESKLLAAIEKINGQRRLLDKNDPQNNELFLKLAPLQLELAELRKKFRG